MGDVSSCTVYTNSSSIVYTNSGGICDFFCLLVGQVNCLKITPDKQILAAAGNPHVRLFEINSQNSSALASYDGHTTNVTDVGEFDPLLEIMPSALHLLALPCIQRPQTTRRV